MGLNYKEIGLKLELPENTVRKLGLKMGLKGNRPGGKRYYWLDQNWLDKIDSPEKAVFLGFFFADGSNLRNSKCSLYIHKNDKKYLERLSSFYTNKPVYEYGSDCISMICSKQWTENLLRYGAFYAKSLILKWPKNIPEQFIKYFIRGFFEGDGGFGITKDGIIRSVHFTSTKELLLDLQFHLQSFGVESNIIRARKDHDRNTYKLIIGKTLRIKRFCDLIYEDKLEIALERKFQTYKKFLTYRFPLDGYIYLNRRLRKIGESKYSS